MMLTVEELTIIKMYSDDELDRIHVVASLTRSLPLIDVAEIRDLVQSLIEKVSTMSDAEFRNIDLSLAFDIPV